MVGKQDPFVTFRLGEVAKRSKTDYRGGQRPIWDDQVFKPWKYTFIRDKGKKREQLTGLILCCIG